MQEDQNLKAKLELAISSVEKTAFAAAQNQVPILERIALTNQGEAPVSHLRIEMTPQPLFCRMKEWVLDEARPGETIEISDRDLPLDFAFLEGLNEAERGHLTFRLFQEDTLISEQSHEIELLPRDEWGGCATMAQLLAAFVSPNHSAIARILKKASVTLEDSGHRGSLEGYQSEDP